MKNKLRSKAAKITMVILFVLSVSLALGSALAAMVFYDRNVYSVPIEKQIDLIIEENIGNDLIQYAERTINVSEDKYPIIYGKENSNLNFAIYSETGKLVSTNVKDDITINNNFWQHHFYFTVEQDDRPDIENTKYIKYIGTWSSVPFTSTYDIYTFCVNLDDGLPEHDEYRAEYTRLEFVYSVRYAVIAVSICSALSAVILCIILMSVSAREPYSDGLHPGPLNSVPFDLLLAAVIFAVYLAIGVVADLDWNIRYYDYAGVIASILILAAVSALLLGILVSLAARVKQKNLIKNTVCYRVIAFAVMVFKNVSVKCRAVFSGLPTVWRTVFWVFLLLCAELFLSAVSDDRDVIIIIWIIERIIFIPLIIAAAVYLRGIEAGGQALSRGEFDHRIDTSIMFGALKRHGENLNSIAGGMSAAVEKRLQSERMKTELITNVSHDIKTPLTSIINYADLITKEECNSQNHKEYSEVLMRKSEHLKRLLDDLVEASKAASGNLDVDLAPCDAKVLLTQTAGEFEQKCSSADLHLVTSAPEGEIRIMTDSRRIWRVFENLMNNAVKYSLPGSRVYLLLDDDGDSAVFTFKNTSKEQLTVSPEELTERFVRGDASRTTEGNGLGLSIAQSLTELQGGSMRLTVDGDLFKVTLKFPKI